MDFTSTEVDLNQLVIQAPRLYGNVRTAWIDRLDKRPRQTWMTPELKIQFPVRPSSETDLSNVQLELAVPAAQAAFLAKAAEFDGIVRKAAYDMRQQFFGGRVISGSSPEGVPMKGLIRGGSLKADGSQFDSTLRLRVNGCENCIKDVITACGKGGRYVKDVSWDPSVAPTTSEIDTQWLMSVAVDGKEEFAATVTDAAGKQRAVGPWDARPGAVVKVEFYVPKVWAAGASIGVSPVAKRVYIRAPASSAQAQAGRKRALPEGVELMEW